jgi:hypothetical protein
MLNVQQPLLSARQKSDFDTLGYALVENVVPSRSLSLVREYLDDLWDEAKRGRIAKIRVYDDFPRFLGGLNVAGIENPFVAAPLLADVVRTCGIDKLLAGLTGWPGADLEVARLHMNDRFKYQGFWHRDAKVDEADSSVVAVLYFRDEKGFRIIPQTSDWNSAKGDELQRTHSYAAVADERIMSAPAGSIFFMKSYLPHRGYNNRKRLHLHMRFVKAARYDVEAWARFRHDDAADYDFAASSPLQRTRNFISYCLPRPGRSSLFQA